MAHILVIDDEMDICRLIEKVLGRDGHTVSVRNRRRICSSMIC